MNVSTNHQDEADSPLDKAHSECVLRRRKKQMLFWRIVGRPGLILFFVCSLLFLCFHDPTLRERGVTDPKSRFEEETDLRWPSSAKVISADDSHWDEESGPVLMFLTFGPGLLDGEMHIIFDTDPADLKQWIENPAPWGVKWNEGTIPDYILSKTDFPIQVKSESIKYAAHERVGNQKRSPGFEFWDGELLVLDVELGRVWLSSWDF